MKKKKKNDDDVEESGENAKETFFGVFGGS